VSGQGPASATESVEELRARAAAWLEANMAPRHEAPALALEARTVRDRQLQRRLWEGRLAGICWPAEYGGLGLSPAHQRAFDEVSLPYELPLSLNIPTFGILAATLIELGTHEQKLRHLPAILRGEERWVQLLSEPTGGSDLAGCVTRAERDGDVFVLNGSKIWSSAAHVSEWAMCLARTNWDVPKHRGLTMLVMPIDLPGVQVEQIRQVDGSAEFCQEFLDDVVLPASAVVGEVDDGWSVASRLLLHERTAVAGGSPYTSGRTSGGQSSGPDRTLLELAESRHLGGDPRVRQLVAQARVDELVNEHLVERVTTAMAAGKAAPAVGSILKLFHAELLERRSDLALEIAGPDVVAWPSGRPGVGARLGRASLSRQAMSLGGGSNEIQRNIISERVLGMPREWAADRDVPYRDVQRNAMPSGPR
jgi:alkylation response protein AidB-like acyl-CoA dehydrogenase